jgi:hypothetical protein
MQLHWLPIEQRISVYKIILLTFKALMSDGLAPQYTVCIKKTEPFKFKLAITYCIVI